MDGLLQDMRHAARMMRRAPTFTAAVVVTMALALAANTAIFSFVNAVMLKPLPFRDPGRLLQVAEKNDKLNLPSFGASVLNFVSWRERTHGFQELGGIGTNTYTLTGAGDPEQLTGNRISPALTRVLGITPIAGRGFADDEESRWRRGRYAWRGALEAPLRSGSHDPRPQHHLGWTGYDGRGHRARGFEFDFRRGCLYAHGHRSCEGNSA
jgi:hypothetical protein